MGFTSGALVDCRFGFRGGAVVFLVQVTFDATSFLTVFEYYGIKT